jgi:hypothetical protein
MLGNLTIILTYKYIGIISIELLLKLNLKLFGAIDSLMLSIS